MYLPLGFKAFSYNPHWAHLKNTKRFGACHSMTFLSFILSSIFSKWITIFACFMYILQGMQFLHSCTCTHVHMFSCWGCFHILLFKMVKVLAIIYSFFCDNSVVIFCEMKLKNACNL
jgi:hypothetical protein